VHASSVRRRRRCCDDAACDVQIPAIADLPVGENLQDQVMADGIEMFTPYSGFTVTAARAENFISAWAYSIFGTGIRGAFLDNSGLTFCACCILQVNFIFVVSFSVIRIWFYFIPHLCSVA